MTNGALDFDLPDEQAFDGRFQSLVESIADDDRPSWVTDSLSIAAEALAGALQQAAPEVDFKVNGQPRRSFRSVDIHRETWHVVASQDRASVTFTGRLYAANLNTHRLQVQDDIGNHVGLPDVADDAEIGNLLGSHVIVSGSPQVDGEGRLTHIHEAYIEAAPALGKGFYVHEAVPLDEILAAAPGPDPNGGIELTDDSGTAFGRLSTHERAAANGSRSRHRRSTPWCSCERTRPTLGCRVGGSSSLVVVYSPPFKRGRSSSHSRPLTRGENVARVSSARSSIARRPSASTIPSSRPTHCSSPSVVDSATHFSRSNTPPTAGSQRVLSRRTLNCSPVMESS